MGIWTTIRSLLNRFIRQSDEQSKCATNSDSVRITPEKTVGIVSDTPNGTRTVESWYGQGVRPDFQQLLNIAKEKGHIASAIAVANAGIPRYVVTDWARLGYSIRYGTAPDCDETVFAAAMAVGMKVDVLFLCSGDHCFAPVVQALTRLGKQVFVIAVRTSTAQVLLASATGFIEMPVIRHQRRPPSKITSILQSQNMPRLIGSSAGASACR